MYTGMGDRVALLLWLKHRNTNMDLIGQMMMMMMMMMNAMMMIDDDDDECYDECYDGDDDDI
jgi:hypothetical protein